MTRRQEKGERMRLDILRSAACVFRKKGFHSATMEDISERLLMTKGSLYYYFKNKEEIFYHCQEYVLDKLLEGLQKAETMRGDPAGRLQYLVQNHIRVITEGLSGAVLHLDFDLLSPLLLGPIIAKRDRYEKGIRRAIQEGSQQGVFRRCDAKLTAFALLGALNWISKWYSPEGGCRSEDIGQTFADYLVGGLRNRDLLAPAKVNRFPRRKTQRSAQPTGEQAIDQNVNFAEASWLL